MYKVNEYNKATYTFPGDNVSPEVKKSKEYRIAWNEALYSAWLRNRLNGYIYKDRPSMIRRRLYSIGKQDETQYMKMFLGQNVDMEAARNGYMNVNWKVFNIAMKYKKAFIGKFSEMDFAVMLQSRSLSVINEKDEAKYRSYVMQKVREKIPDMPGSGTSEPGIEPQSLEELKILDKMGGFTHKVEFAMQELVEAVLADGWDDKMITDMLSDIWENHITCAWDYVDPNTGVAGVKRVDYMNVLYRAAENGEVIDGGYLELMTINDLRATGEFSETDLMEIAKSACGSFGNPFEWNWNKDYIANPSKLGNCPWDDHRVLVLHAEQRCVDTYNYSENQNKPNKPVRREKFDYKSTSSNRKHLQKTRENFYQGSLIIGTKHMFNYGPQDTAPRPNLSRSRCSLHVIQLDGPSPVEQCEAVFDQVQICWTKYQNQKITGMNSGWAIDESLLIETELGGKLTPAQQIRMARNTGVLLYRTTDARGRNTMSPNSPSIMKMQGSEMDIANAFITEYNMMIQILGDLTGLSGPSVAQPVEGKKVNELQLAATGTILKPMIDGVKFMKKSLSKNIILRMTMVLKYVPSAREYYTGVLGTDCMNILLMAIEKDYREYGIVLKVTNNTDIIEELKMMTKEAFKAGQAGMPGLEWLEAAQITRLLYQGVSPQYVEAFIGRAIEKRKKEAHERAMAEQQAQSEGQAKLQAIVMETQKELEDHKTKNAAELAVTTRTIDHYFTMKENAQAALDAVGEQVGGVILETLVGPLLQSAAATAQQNQQTMQQNQQPQMQPAQ